MRKADELNKRGLENRIVNAREQHKLKFRKEVHLRKVFTELWDKIKCTSPLNWIQ